MSFTALEIERFKKHDARVMKLSHAHSAESKCGHHQSYLAGWIRCVNCLKWVHPWKHPEHWAEIIKGKSGKMRHKNCPVSSPYVAAFATVPRHRPSKRMRLRNVKRY